MGVHRLTVGIGTAVMGTEVEVGEAVEVVDISRFRLIDHRRRSMISREVDGVEGMLIHRIRLRRF